MKKINKENTTYWKGILLVILVVLLTGSFIYYKMPKENCHDEISIRSVTFQGFCYEFSYGERCVNTWYFLEEDEEVICEDGIDEHLGLIEYNGKEPKVCLFKKTKEICEIK